MRLLSRRGSGEQPTTAHVSVSSSRVQIVSCIVAGVGHCGSLSTFRTDRATLRSSGCTKKGSSMDWLRRGMPGCIRTILATAICSVGLAVVATSQAAAETTPPTITITTPTEGRHYALNATVTAAFSCEDPGPGASGVATCAAAGPVSTATAGPHTFTVNAADNAGNTATKTVNYVVDPDTTRPAITITSPADGHHYAQGATILATFSCADAGGSGVATCAAATPIDTGVGTHAFTVNATDNAGNTATKTVNYTVDADTTPPTITITSPVNGHHYPLGTITATYSCADAGGSGVTSCTAAAAIDTTVGTHAFTVNATDGAGNTATKTVDYTVDPDTTSPTIAITSPVDGQHYPFGTAVPGTYTCDDTGGSGLATCAAATAVDLTAGTHVFTVNATDGAGNPATKSVTYVVDAQPAGGGETPGTGTPGGAATSPATQAPATAGSGTPTPQATTSATPRVTLPTRASTTALARGVTVSLSRLKPRSRVELRVRRGLRTIKVVSATAAANGTARLRLTLGRAQLRTLRGKTLTLRFATTAANGTSKVITRRLKVV